MTELGPGSKLRVTLTSRWQIVAAAAVSPHLRGAPPICQGLYSIKPPRAVSVTLQEPEWRLQASWLDLRQPRVQGESFEEERCLVIRFAQERVRLPMGLNQAVQDHAALCKETGRRGCTVQGV
jgi:hypothetical protein